MPAAGDISVSGCRLYRDRFFLQLVYNLFFYLFFGFFAQHHAVNTLYDYPRPGQIFYQLRFFILAPAAVEMMQKYRDLFP